MQELIAQILVTYSFLFQSVLNCSEADLRTKPVAYIARIAFESIRALSL